MFQTAVRPVLETKPRASSSSAAAVLATSTRDRWTCSKCTMRNDGVNLNCTVCMNSRPGQRINLKQEQEKVPQMGVVNSRFSHRLKSLFSKTPPDWTCPLCTYINGGYYTQCQSCRFVRVVKGTQSQGSDSRDQGEVRRKTKSVSSEEESAAGTTSVFESIKAFFRRSPDVSRSKSVSRKLTEREEKRAEGGDGKKREWACQQCTFLNRDSLEKCTLCDLPRDLAVPDSLSSKSVERDSAPATLTLDQSRPNSATATVDNTEPRVDHSRNIPGMSESNDKATPLPKRPHSPQARQSFVSSQGVPTWCCQVCRAYNVVDLTQCFICGIGKIPEQYLPHGAEDQATFNPKSATPKTKLESYSSQSRNQQQQNLNPLSESSEPDYVNVFTPPAPTPRQSHKSSPHHPLTHFNQLQVSPTPSPQHITGSNDRAAPQMEHAQPTSAHSVFRVGPSYHQHTTVSDNGIFPYIEQAQPPYQHSSASNDRVFPSLEQPLYLSSSDITDFQTLDSSLEESCIDPYTRPRTPTDAHKTPRKRETLEKPTTLHQRQYSDEKGKGRRRIEASVHFNRTKCLQETRYEDVVRSVAVYHEIQQYSRQSGEPFTDPDFPPTDKSLYVDPSNPVVRWGVRKWQRPAGIRDDFDSDGIDWTVIRSPRPDDLAQGVLGNCWVLSALAVIAEQPQLIKDILITKEYSPGVGAYHIRLCRDGKWEIVVIDDCFPCLNSGQLVFSKAHRKQLWVPLIEKALAKLYGSYEALNSGRVLLGLSVLTGLPCEKIHIKKPSTKGDAIDTDLVWATLLSFRERGFPMSASCGGEGEEERVYAMLGLEVNHAYSILDVRQLDSERLVRLRNPWGKYSWKGSWSDQDSRWQSHPYLREELQAVGADAGVFWMGAQEFFQYFCEVDVCKYRPNWHSLHFEGKLHPYAARQIKTLAFEVRTNTEVDISIYQPSSRGKSSAHSLVDMAVLVLCYSDTHTPLSSSDPSPLPASCSLHSGSFIQSIVTTNGFLTPGRYVLLPLAFNNYRHVTAGSKHTTSDAPSCGEVEGQQNEEPGSVPYVVAVFSAQELAYENVTTRPGFLAESLMLLAEKIGKVTEPFPKMLLYEVYMRHSCRYVVAVNLDKKHHFTVTCDGLDSVNVLSSRGELYTQDCIPPRHKQVLWVLTQLEGTARYSVLMRIASTCSQLNSRRQWGAQHTPPLTPTTSELHGPRLIS